MSRVVEASEAGPRDWWRRWGWGRHHWELLALFASCIGLAYVFLKLGSEIHEGELAAIDGATRHIALAHRAAALTALAEAMTYLGTRGLFAPIAAFLAWRLSDKDYTTAALVLLAGYVSAEFVDVIKVIFSIPRPATGLAERQSSSFPSGHVSGVASLAAIVSLIALRHHKRPVLVAVASAIVVLLMAFSRIYLDMHWFSDVIGGMLVGGVIGVGFTALYEWHRLRLQQRTTALTNSNK